MLVTYFLKVVEGKVRPFIDADIMLEGLEAAAGLAFPDNNTAL
jgi:hypothetical protein